MPSFPWLAAALALGVLALPATARAQTPGFAIANAAWPEVVDPKLPGARVDFGFDLQPLGVSADVTLTLRQNGVDVGRIWSWSIRNSRAHIVHPWDGRTVTTAGGATVAVAPGSYEVVVRAVELGTHNVVQVQRPLHLVRVGITEIEAQPNGTDTEWQMVYFKRGTQVAPTFYVTPAIHEYLNVAGAGEVSDLDLDNGQPRPVAPLHTDTASPPMEGLNYEDDSYNFPVCYRAGVQPKLQVTFGSSCTGPNGQAMGVGYPVAGMRLRCVVDSTAGAWSPPSADLQPGGTADYYGPALPAEVGRLDTTMFWAFESSTDGGASWSRLPGALQTQHRFYTILGRPIFASTVGTQHAGPWVEVVDYLHQWKTALGIYTSNAATVTQALIVGFGGQVGSLTTAIEGVRYDAYPLGGDGGASHYFLSSSVQLAKLLDAHANGVFVNCSDCASATATMMSMLGVPSVQMVYLGPMTLRAIRGIGAPAYTLSLWGSAHGFSYHHVVSRDAGAHICDACLWVDEDGSPSTLPGTPGYNVDRVWTNRPVAYMDLLATAPFTKTLQSLPTLQ